MDSPKYAPGKMVEITPIVLDVNGAAQYLSVSPDYIRKLRALEKLPCVKLGSRVLFRIKDLDAYVDEHLC